MQQIMTYTTGSSIFLQSAEIFKNAKVCLRNSKGEELLNKKMINTNYLRIEGKHPKGEYLIIVKENGKQWKRSVYIGD